jgi:hypothetical protein
MKKKALGFMLLITLVVGLIGGCSGSDDSDSNSASKFVGLWRMSLVGDPSDPGFDWRFNADKTTIVLYETGSTNPKGSGTCAIEGESARGTWSVGAPNVGRFTATLTGDNSMDFNFIEEKYSPAKTFVYVGARLE